MIVSRRKLKKKKAWLSKIFDRNRIQRWIKKNDRKKKNNKKEKKKKDDNDEKIVQYYREKNIIRAESRSCHWPKRALSFPWCKNRWAGEWSEAQNE